MHIMQQAKSHKILRQPKLDQDSLDERETK